MEHDDSTSEMEAAGIEPAFSARRGQIRSGTGFERRQVG
jgi:hypothetical protein